METFGVYPYLITKKGGYQTFSLLVLPEQVGASTEVSDHVEAGGEKHFHICAFPLHPSSVVQDNKEGGNGELGRGGRDTENEKAYGHIVVRREGTHCSLHTATWGL